MQSPTNSTTNSTTNSIDNLLRTIATANIELLLRRRLIAQRLHPFRPGVSMGFEQVTASEYLVMLAKNHGSGCMLNAALVLDLLCSDCPCPTSLPSLRMWNVWDVMGRILVSRGVSMALHLAWRNITTAYTYSVEQIEQSFTATRRSVPNLVHLMAINDPGQLDLPLQQRFAHAWLIVQSPGPEYRMVSAAGDVFTLSDWMGVAPAYELGTLGARARSDAQQSLFQGGRPFRWRQLQVLFTMLKRLSRSTHWTEDVRLLCRRLFGFNVEGRVIGSPLVHEYHVSDGSTWRVSMGDCLVYQCMHWSHGQASRNLEWFSGF